MEWDQAERPTTGEPDHQLEVRALGVRIKELRDHVRGCGQDLGEDLLRELDEWIAEGEELHQKAEWRLSMIALSASAEDSDSEMPLTGFYFG